MHQCGKQRLSSRGLCPQQPLCISSSTNTFPFLQLLFPPELVADADATKSNEVASEE